MRSGASVTKPEMVVEPAGRFWPIKQVKFSRAKIKLIAAVVALVFGVASSSWARVIEGSTPGGSVITNQARATYSDDTGETFETVSETVTLTVVAVASITVTPDETTPRTLSVRASKSRVLFASATPATRPIA